MSFAISVTLNSGGTTEVLAGVASRARDLSPVMDDIGNMLQLSADMCFQAEQDPDGNAWTPLAPDTVKRKAKAGHEGMLQWSGALRRSIHRRVEGNSVTVGTNLPYAAIQQFGGDVTRHAHTSLKSLLSFREVTREATRKDGSKVRYQGKVFAKANAKGIVAQARRTIGAATISIPSRPFVGISDGDKARAIEKLRRYLLGGGR